MKNIYHIQSRINFVELILRKVSYAPYNFRDSEYYMIGIFFIINLFSVKGGKLFGLVQMNFICSLLGLVVKASITFVITKTVFCMKICFQQIIDLWITN
jgi:hypothetical protein